MSRAIACESGVPVAAAGVLMSACSGEAPVTPIAPSAQGTTGDASAPQPPAPPSPAPGRTRHHRHRRHLPPRTATHRRHHHHRRRLRRREARSSSMTISEAARCFRRATGGTRTSPRRRSMRSRTRSSTSSGAIARCIPISVRRLTAFRTWASAAPNRACRSRSSTTATRATRDFAARRDIRFPKPPRRSRTTSRAACRRRHRRRSPHADRRSRSLGALRAVRGAMEPARAMGSRLGRGVRSLVERPTSGRLDIGRCRGPRDPAGAGALRRGAARARQSRAARHRARHERLRVAGVASRRQPVGRAADGRAAPAEGVEGHLAAIPRTSEHIFRAMQTYGLIVADNGSDMYITGAMDCAGTTTS